MTRLLITGLLAAAVACSGSTAQSPDPSGSTFRLGMFEAGNTTFPGLVVGDDLVVDIAQANAAYESESGAPAVTIPSDTNGIIARYGELSERLAALAGAAAEADSGATYLHQVDAVDVLPPVQPQTILNAAVNYTEHAAEMSDTGEGTTEAPDAESIPAIWERAADDTRHNPYLFLKPTAAVIGSDDAIRLPPGRTNIDYECELALVVGRTASRVPVDQAREYIFGYTSELDVSDRGGREDGRHGSDWFIGKGHDTFAPLGPYVVPKEFVDDPQNLPVTFTLNGETLQDSDTQQMTHSVYEMLSFASHILTLQPGDIVATGSPPGVGTARDVPIYLQPGDVTVCTIGSNGALTNRVVGDS